MNKDTKGRGKQLQKKLRTLITQLVTEMATTTEIPEELLETTTQAYYQDYEIISDPVAKGNSNDLGKTQ